MAEQHLAIPIKQARVPKMVQGVAQALEQGNIKLALKRSEAILERHPTHAFCKALRAMALELNGSRLDALVLCREVKLAKTADPHILSYVAGVYQRASMYSELSSVYEVALEENPQCEENGVNLFRALATELKLQSQQKVAVDLFRRHGDQRYILWAVGSILAQVPTFGPNRSLDLAEVLLQRYPVDLARAKREGATAKDMYDGYVMLLAHLTSLRQQRKYTQALRLLDAQDEAVPLPLDAARLRLQLSAEAGLSDIFEVAKAKLLQRVDQWSACKEFIVIAFAADGYCSVRPVPFGATVQGDNGAHQAHGTEPMGRATGGGGRADVTSRAGQDQSPEPHEMGGYGQRVVPKETQAAPSGASVGKPGDAITRSEFSDFASRTGSNSQSSARSRFAPSLNKSGGDPNWNGYDGGQPARPKAFRIRSSVFANADGSESMADAADQNVKDAYALLKHLQHTAREHGSRTPFLGELEFRALAFACSELEGLQRAHASGDGDQRSWMSSVSHCDLDDFIDAIAAYFERYGHHTVSCCLDLKPYLCLLDDTRAQTLLVKLRNTLRETRDEAEKLANERELGSPTSNASAHSFGDVGSQHSRWSEWTRCTEANRALAFARMQRSLRAIENLSLDRAAEEVSALVSQWYELHQWLHAEGSTELVVMHRPPAVRGSRCNASDSHAFCDETRPTADPEELLLLAAVHLLDMDRNFCARWAGGDHDNESTSGVSPCAVGGGRRLPTLRERAYMIDALALLELAVKASPRCVRVRLLLAVAYGSIGAALPLQKWYNSVGIVHGEREALGHLILDRLLLLGWWADFPGICNSLQEFHAEFEKLARAELARVHGRANEQGAVHRSREYMRALDTMRRSVMRARATVERLVVQVAQLGDCGEALYDFLNPQIGSVREIAKEPTSNWLTETQDRGIFQGLHVLPRCTPLQALHLGVVGAPLVMPPRAGGTLFPRPPPWADVFRQGPMGAIVSSIASIWPPEAAPAATGASTTAAWAQSSAFGANGLSAMAAHAPSGLEEMLTPRTDAGAGVMKLRALLLMVLHTILRPHPSEPDLAEILRDFQANLVAEGLTPYCDPGALFKDGAVTALPKIGNMMSKGAAGPVSSNASSGTGGGSGGVGGNSGANAAGALRFSNDEVSASGSALQKVTRHRPSEAPQTSRMPAVLEVEIMAVGGGPGGNGAGAVLRKQTKDRADNTPGARPASPWSARFGSQSSARPTSAATVALSASVAHDEAPVGVVDPKAGLPPPWRPTVATADALFWRCVLLACDVAHRTLQVAHSEKTTDSAPSVPPMEAARNAAMTSNDALGKRGRLRYPSEEDVEATLAELMSPSPTVVWDALRRGLTVLRLVTRECANAMLQEPLTPNNDATPEKKARGEAFRMGGHGVPTLCAFITGPLLVLLPILGLVSSRIMKPVGIPKHCGPLKAAEIAKRMAAPPPGGAMADEARSALGHLADELRSVLKEILSGLVEAQADEFDHLGDDSGGGAAPAPQRPPRVQLPSGKLQDNWDIDSARRMVSHSLVGSHRRQLEELEKVVASHITQLKGLNTRPPGK